MCVFACVRACVCGKPGPLRNKGTRQTGEVNSRLKTCYLQAETCSHVMYLLLNVNLQTVCVTMIAVKTGFQNCNSKCREFLD